MKDRYDGNPSKDARMAKVRHERMEAEHNSKNEFVKRQQMEVKGMGGKSPDLRAASLDFDAYMCNTGEHAQEFARSLTKGLDKEAFPVR